MQVFHRQPEHGDKSWSADKSSPLAAIIARRIQRKQSWPSLPDNVRKAWKKGAKADKGDRKPPKA